MSIKSDLISMESFYDEYQHEVNKTTAVLEHMLNIQSTLKTPLSKTASKILAVTLEQFQFACPVSRTTVKASRYLDYSLEEFTNENDNLIIKLLNRMMIFLRTLYEHAKRYWNKITDKSGRLLKNFETLKRNIESEIKIDLDEEKSIVESKRLTKSLFLEHDSDSRFLTDFLNHLQRNYDTEIKLINDVGKVLEDDIEPLLERVMKEWDVENPVIFKDPTHIEHECDQFIAKLNNLMEHTKTEFFYAGTRVHEVKELHKDKAFEIDGENILTKHNTVVFGPFAYNKYLYVDINIFRDSVVNSTVVNRTPVSFRIGVMRATINDRTNNGQHANKIRLLNKKMCLEKIDLAIEIIKSQANYKRVDNLVKENDIDKILNRLEYLERSDVNSKVKIWSDYSNNQAQLRYGTVVLLINSMRALNDILVRSRTLTPNLVLETLDEVYYYVDLSYREALKVQS